MNKFPLFSSEMFEAHAGKKDSLRRKFLRSHLHIAMWGSGALFIALIAFFWMRTSAIDLATNSGPIYQKVNELSGNLNQSSASLRGWVAVKNPVFIKERHDVWKNKIEPNLDKLKELLDQHRDDESQMKVKELEKTLIDLKNWQWHIEDIAQTPGNIPANSFKNLNILPVEEEINSLIHSLLTTQKSRGALKQKDKVLRWMLEIQVYFLKSSGALLNFLELGLESDAQNFDYFSERTHDLLRKIKKELLTREAWKLFKLLKEEFLAYGSLCEESMQIRRSKRWNTANFLLSEKAIPLAQKSAEFLDRFSVSENERMRSTARSVSWLSNIVPLLIFGLIILLVVVATFFANRGSIILLKPISSLVEATRKLASGTLKEDIEIIGKDELSELTTSFNKMNTSLQTSQNKLKKANTRMSQELNVARGIQMSMVPLIFPAFPENKEFDIYAKLIPAREVGGDFYDFYMIDNDYICLTIGDVSGKGVPAALMMAVCRTLLNSRAIHDLSPASVMTYVNEVMARENLNYMFVTVFLGILNIKTGEMIYTNAGHNPTIIKKSGGSVHKLTDLHGPVVAAMEGFAYKESKTQIDKGDMIFAYTDGISEAHNIKDELYTDARLASFLSENNFNNAENWVKNVVKSVADFEVGREQFDDITALCIRFMGLDAGAELTVESFTLNNEISEIQKAIQRFESFADKTGISNAIKMKISIVLDEILANVVNYAYPDGSSHEIYIDFEFNSKKLSITIKDDGIPFNPLLSQEPDTTLPVNKREIGGLGIHLVRNLMDECDYKRNINQNILTLVKVDVNKL